MVNKELIQSLLSDTKSGKLQWENVMGQSCCSASYQSINYIICQYTEDEIAIGKLDSRGYLNDDDYYEFNRNHQLFSLLSELEVEVTKVKKEVEEEPLLAY